ncbi:histidinol-phosphatase [Shimia biformata]|uniref:histidinol-phosphatase n=1 Tax=Shimia biformata TaxID=1294299 RepID=UPI00194EC434|nr:histidinol-phosphatase [Shimia biformata]
MDQSEKDDIRDVASELADVAREAILPFFRRTDLVADNKLDGGFDPVTAADRASEAAMRAILAKRRPDDAIMGEEFDDKPGTTGLTWVLDPIDGTRGFISGTPTWGVLISVMNQDGPIHGVIDQPYIGERFSGGLGVAEVTGPIGTAALRVSSVKALNQATVFTTFPEVGTTNEGQGFANVARHCKLTRYGMDCYAYALLAAGQIDMVIEAGLHAYDVQAPIAVIEAAGGIVTGWKGEKIHMGGRVLAAATPELHAAALKILSEIPD